MKTNTDKTNPHAKSISFDSHTNPVLTFIRGECTAYFFSTSYTMDDGLAANRVYSILQDSCGFMWFGTDDGLSRFDGISFKNYYLSEYINATTSNSVKKIFIDRRGRMWIGLDTGIVIYDSKTDTFQPFHAKTETGEMIQTYVTDMIEDSDGEVWIATSGEGLYRFSPHDEI